MEKANTLTARKGITFATALLLVLAIFTSLFVVTLGKAEDKDPNKYTVTFDANGGYFDEVDDKGNNKTTIARTGYKGQGLDDKSALVPHYPADDYGVEGKFLKVGQQLMTRRSTLMKQLTIRKKTLQSKLSGPTKFPSPSTISRAKRTV